MATCVEVTGAAYPQSFGTRQVRPMEGVSLAPAFKTGSFQRAQPIFFEHEGNRAVRDGNWKLVKLKNGEWELYDLEADRTELHDLAADQTERVKTMAAMWGAWAVCADVLREPK